MNKEQQVPIKKSGMRMKTFIDLITKDGKKSAHYKKDCMDDNTVRFHLRSDEVDNGFEAIEIRFDTFSAAVGQDGYFIVPSVDSCFLIRFMDRDDTEYVCEKNLMPIFGVQKGDTAWLGIVTGMSYEYHLISGIKNGQYYQYLRFFLYGFRPYEDIKIDFIKLQGDDATYAGMARAYRCFQLERNACIPLKERIVYSEKLQYAIDTPLIRIRQGWKPAPPTILEQTLDTEPDMRVAMTFEQIERLMDLCYQKGLRKLEFCLVGWNCKGHDGRWPQMMPVEEALGGEAGLHAVIKKANEYGYRIAAHTNSSDAYTISDCWDEEYIIKSQDGSLSVNENAWSGGRMYNVCPKRALERFAPEMFRHTAHIGFNGIHYIDVLTVVPPHRCFDEKHYLNGRDCVEYLNRILLLAQENFGAISSEGGIDFACGNLDFVLYAGFNVLRGLPSLADEAIPLWQIVYHGIILSNPAAETVNYSVKDTASYLKLLEYGGRPVIYFYSDFMEEGGMHWMGKSDFTWNTEQDIENSIQCIEQTVNEYNQFKHLQYEFMDNHQKLADGVYETTFSDGTVLKVDYNTGTYTLNNIKQSLEDGI